jgi:hypothetical protein
MLRQFFTNTPLAAGASQTVGWGSLQGSQFQDQSYLMVSGISDQPGVLYIYESDDTKTASMTRTVVQVPITGGSRFNTQATIRCMSWQVVFQNQGGAQVQFELAVDSSTNPPVNFDASGNLLVNINASSAAAVPSSTVDPLNANTLVPFSQWMQLEMEILIEIRKQNELLVWLKEPQAAAVPVQLADPMASFSAA